MTRAKLEPVGLAALGIHLGFNPSAATVEPPTVAAEEGHAGVLGHQGAGLRKPTGPGTWVVVVVEECQEGCSRQAGGVVDGADLV